MATYIFDFDGTIAPWRQSTGVRTIEGKSISKMNAYKHGGYCVELRELHRQFSAWKKSLSQLV